MVRRGSIAAIGTALLAVGALRADGLPSTERIEVKETLHGVELVDPYRWLEDQKSPATRAWLDVQGKFTQSKIRDLPVRATIAKRLGELMKIDAIGVPIARGNRLFFTRRLANEDLASICSIDHGNKQPIVLIDPLKISSDKQVSVTVLDVSRDGSLLAYGIRKGGEDEVEIRFLNLADNKELADAMPRARYMRVQIEPNKKGFYYSIYTPEGPRGRRHEFGKNAESDATVFGAELPKGRILSLDLSDDGKRLLYLVYYGSSGSKTDVFMQEVGGAVRPLIENIDGRFMPIFVGNDVVVSTNWKAPRGRVLLANPAEPDVGKWKTLVPESESILTGVTAIGGRLVLEYLDNAASRVAVVGMDGAFQRNIELPVRGSADGFSGEWDNDAMYFSFASFLRAGDVRKVDLKSGQSETWALLDVPFSPDGFEEKQVTYASKDGTKIPMFIVHKKGLKLDGNNPVYLTGYGGFNLPMTPAFSSTAVVWVENGGVFAMPNLRGGGEFGEDWHKAGMLGNKQNVFDDFIAAAEWLIANGYTKSEKLAIVGGSNGGLLVGAAMTQRPELFRAVICAVPLLDMVRYHRFLVARFWVPEYGSSENAEQFKFIHAYSPYHRVIKGTKYPATLIVTGDSDTRVDPLHARKYCALLQWANGSEHPILLHYDTKSGHSQGLPIDKQVSDTADKIAFLFWQLGM